jgi:tRNA threonylcarbamoyladenosine biosynthesis protein TsaE
MKKILSTSENDTFQAGVRLGKTLKSGDVVACQGELGSGKTVFARGICAALHIDGVHSPTFTLVNEYYGDLAVYHFDAYRVSAEDWLDAGFDDYLYADGVCVIEWGENVADLLPKHAIIVNFSRGGGGDDYREITIRGERF